MPNQPSGLLVPAYDYPNPHDWDVLTDIGRTMMLGGLTVIAAHDHGHFKSGRFKLHKSHRCTARSMYARPRIRS
jgi:hypothetical protein